MTDPSVRNDVRLDQIADRVDDLHPYLHELLPDPVAGLI